MYKFILIFAIAALTIACGGEKSSRSASTSSGSSETTASSNAQPVVSGPNGKKIFRQSCTVCHGIDGKLGANGSKDLTLSTLTIDEKITQITDGKGVMTPFGGILSEEEIKAVAEYTMTLVAAE